MGPKSADLAGEPFYRQLRFFRKRVGLSHKKLALLLDVSRDSVRSWERNKSVPTPGHFGLLEGELLLSVSEHEGFISSWRTARKLSQLRLLGGRKRPGS